MSGFGVKEQSILKEYGCSSNRRFKVYKNTHQESQESQSKLTEPPMTQSKTVKRHTV